MASVKKSPYDIIRRPIITEKTAMLGSVSRAICFEVHPSANKIEIKEAVEKAFDVKVEKVRSMNYMGKVKRVGTRVGRRAAWAKAYVTLKQGHEINVIDGL